nr:MAG TPA: hypothetical protein [Caudoviricetes sp.]
MFLEAGILTRRSVRQFQPDKEIPQSDIDDILKLAMYAPSACNKRPWEFVVVKSKEAKDKLAEIHPHARFLKDASLAIVVCGDTFKEAAPGYWVVDTSIAAQNLLLACHGRGLGACWCGIYPDENRMKEIAEFLALPENIKPNALIVIGYPAKIPPQPKDRVDEESVKYI